MKLPEHALRWFQFDAMGSPCAIGYVPDPDAIHFFETEAIQWLRDFERRYSRYNPDSLVSMINEHAGGDWIDIDAETESIFSIVDRAHQISGGVFDPTALPLVLLWDYKENHAQLPSDADVARARDLVGWDRVERRSGAARLPIKGMGIDLGGICKEYAVDRVVEMATRRGHDRFIVDFGQDIRVQGRPPESDTWNIGLENPFQPGASWLTVGIASGAVATSGSYYRNFTMGEKTFGHILDTRTGYPAETPCHAVTVIAAECWLAGVLSTSAFLLGPEEGIRLLESHGEGCIVTDTNCYTTKDFEQMVIA